jgi:DNA-binding CsgD family transcriptional regulator/tetratricopeptide (TPR) repeat protein
MSAGDSALSFVSSPLSSLGLYSKRVTQSLVGRTIQLAAVEQELAAAERGMVCLAMEGEPGIGKTRLLLSIEELARNRGFTAVGATADEEIRGPFLLARSIFASPPALEAARGTPAEEAIERLVDALFSRDDPGLESLSPERKLLRVFDLAAGAIRLLASQAPLAILLDDLQWADDDSVRMLRYIVRTNAASRIFLVLASRPSEMAAATEAVTLLADVERMGLLRRVRLTRFSQPESTEFLKQMLGGPINLASAATMHAQAEGVPFILAEQAHTYRDAGLIQQIDGVWTLARNAERLLPSAVRTLIQRRAARLPDETKSALAQAAVLGRSFSLRDLREVKKRLGGQLDEVDALAESLQPAVASGLLIQHDERSAADYSFTHDQIREYATASLTAPRRRAIHKAVVELLLSGGEPPPASLPLLAQHALAAGEPEMSTRFSIEAAKAALALHAPEEALRLVELAHPIATNPQDRIALLCLRDDALDMLRRPGQRLEGLAELSALTEALGDSHIRLHVMLRRAAALRLSDDHDRAADIARRVRSLAVEEGDKEAELSACLELGQDLLRSEIGEGYTQTPTESDLDGAQEAYESALALAQALDDERAYAAANRELGIISMSRARAIFVELVGAGAHVPVLKRLAAGETLDQILPSLPVAPLIVSAQSYFRIALEIYEKVGDRQGAMSTIIAMAFSSWGAEIHTSGSASRIEEIRRLATRLKSLTRESEREAADAQMVFGVQVYACAKGFPDMAIVKGKEAYDAARAIGDRGLEFGAAGRLAMSYAEMEDFEQAEQWLGRAAVVAAGAPTPFRAFQLESWRGMAKAFAGDAAAMLDHLEKAVKLATDQGRISARCEALARLALAAARLGAEQGDESLLAIAEQSAQEARQLVSMTPGHPPWGPQASVALAMVAKARRADDEALAQARVALRELNASKHEDLSLEILLPAASIVIEHGEEDEASELRDRLQLILTFTAQRIVDEGVRVRWFRGATGRELTRLAGPVDAFEAQADQTDGDAGIDREERRLLQLLAQGGTNQEIARELGVGEEAVARKLGELFVKIGATSRADATAIALGRKLR